jgi:hypothetical protein
MLLGKKYFDVFVVVVSRKMFFTVITIPSYLEALTVKNQKYISLPLPSVLQEIKFDA